MAHQGKILLAGLVMATMVGMSSILLLQSTHEGSSGRMKNDNIVRTSEVHAPILINGNAELALFCLGTGFGNSTHPFIIRDYEIENHGTGSCIDIRNTDLYLEIINCSLLWTSYGNSSGVTLVNCTNVKVIDCYITHTGRGVDVQFCDEIQIAGNVFYDNWDFIMYLNYSTHVSVENNIYDSNNNMGVECAYSDYNTFKNNTWKDSLAFENLLLVYSHHNVVENNTFANVDMHVLWLHGATYNNISRNVFIQTRYRTWYIVDSANNIFSENTVSAKPASETILFENSNTNDVFGNIIEGNSDHGVRLNGNGNWFHANTISASGNHGITMSGTGNLVEMNTFQNNTGYGIYCSGNQNYIIDNFLWDNGDGSFTKQFIDLGSANYWWRNSIGNVTDLDDDGVVDRDEILVYRTDRLIVDTDNDNFLDGYEISFGTDPLNATDFPCMWQSDFDYLLSLLDGNATLLLSLVGQVQNDAARIEALELAIEGNASLVADLSAWLSGNATILSDVIADVDGNATRLDTLWNMFLGLNGSVDDLASWMDGNASLIDDLITHVGGNASLVADLFNYLDANYTLLLAVQAFQASNWTYLRSSETAIQANITAIATALLLLDDVLGDLDCDGLADIYEIGNGTDPTKIDTDCDNLNDAFELKYGTNPLDDDTDGDGYYDGIEVAGGFDPLDDDDYPGATGDQPGGLDAIMTTAIIAGIAAVGIVVFAGIVTRTRKRPRA